MTEVTGNMTERIGPLGDRRSRVYNTRTPPYSAIAHMEMQIQGRWYNGTGFLCYNGSDYFITTAAHNLYSKEDRQYATEVRITLGKNGLEHPFKTIVKRPARYQVPNEFINGNEGYDYGVILLNKERENFNKDVYFVIRCVSDEDIQRYTTSARVYMSGYPGDKDPGTQWGIQLTSISITMRELLYPDATNGGNSGSPVYVEMNGQYISFGIHVVGCANYNKATRISNQVQRDINEMVRSLNRQEDTERPQAASSTGVLGNIWLCFKEMCNDVWNWSNEMCKEAWRWFVDALIDPISRFLQF